MLRSLTENFRVNRDLWAGSHPDNWNINAEAPRRFLSDGGPSSDSYYTPTPEPCETKFALKILVKGSRRDLDLDLLETTISGLFISSAPTLTENDIKVKAKIKLDWRNKKVPGNTCTGFARRRYTELKFTIKTLDEAAADLLELYLADIDLSAELVDFDGLCGLQQKDSKKKIKCPDEEDDDDDEDEDDDGDEDDDDDEKDDDDDGKGKGKGKKD